MLKLGEILVDDSGLDPDPDTEENVVWLVDGDESVG